MPNKNWKIRVNSPEHSVKVQEALFKLGASWRNGGTTPEYMDCGFLYTLQLRSRWAIAFEYCKDHFESSDHKEMFLQPDGTFAEQEFKQQECKMTYQEMENEIMDNFDFGRVHKVMTSLQWEWRDEGVPEVYQLRATARNMLKDAYSIKGFSATGGFWASYKYGSLSLQFVVSDWKCEGENE